MKMLINQNVTFRQSISPWANRHAPESEEAHISPEASGP
jgi:hypothetical protein